MTSHFLTVFVVATACGILPFIGCFFRSMKLVLLLGALSFFAGLCVHVFTMRTFGISSAIAGTVVSLVICAFIRKKTESDKISAQPSPMPEPKDEHPHSNSPDPVLKKVVQPTITSAVSETSGKQDEDAIEKSVCSADDKGLASESENAIFRKIRNLTFLNCSLSIAFLFVSLVWLMHIMARDYWYIIICLYILPLVFCWMIYKRIWYAIYFEYCLTIAYFYFAAITCYGAYSHYMGNNDCGIIFTSPFMAMITVSMLAVHLLLIKHIKSKEISHVFAVPKKVQPISEKTPTATSEAAKSEVIEADMVKFFPQAEDEIKAATMDRELWSLSLVKAEGDEKKRVSIYMKLRAEQLCRAEAEEKGGES